MANDQFPKPDTCNCLAVRQAARHITQYYDQFLAPLGLRTTQFSILAKLRRRGPLTINALAEQMVMDRTTLGRNILPLERERLISVAPGKSDRRSKELALTEAGIERLSAAYQGWTQAQAGFETAYGSERASALRGLLHAASATDLEAAPTGLS
jgi:DNA-binding MarR family transcriptional regulator